ncbi:esterase-like activity of phytase family protein [Sphingomonas sp. RS6]
MRFRFRYLFYPPVALVALSLCASGKEPRIPLDSRHPVFSAVRVPLAPGDPARIVDGALTYLGGVRLSSRDLGFSGFSSLAVTDDSFTLLSDRGNLVRFRMGADWRPFDIRFSELPRGPGIAARKGDRDTESLAHDPTTGRFWVGFEGHNVIWRYNAGFARGETVTYPAAMRGWPQNGGAESMARLPDGRFVVIGETARPPGPGHRGERAVLLFGDDPTRRGIVPVSLSFAPPPGFDPSDAAALPDGRLLVLVRRFALPGLFTARLMLVDPQGWVPGSVLRGRAIADFAPPFQHDNFEGLAVTREGDSLIVWMISDDNEQWWQQTLLLKFRLTL